MVPWFGSFGHSYFTNKDTNSHKGKEYSQVTQLVNDKPRFDYSSLIAVLTMALTVIKIIFENLVSFRNTDLTFSLFSFLDVPYHL